MASGKAYLEFILDQLSSLEGISSRAMMGEYILYCRGKPVGGIYDDRLLVKPTASARRLMPRARAELPYAGAKEMLLVEEVDDRAFLTELICAVAGDLPEPRKRRSSDAAEPFSSPAGGREQRRKKGEKGRKA